MWHVACSASSRAEQGSSPKEGTGDARKADDRASQKRQARGQDADHPGRRVRPRRDGAYPRGKTRGAVNEAGHSNRTLQGAPGRGPAAAAHARSGIGKHTSPGSAGRPRWHTGQTNETVRTTLAGGVEGASTRRPPGGVPHRPGTSSAPERAPAPRNAPIALADSGARVYRVTEYTQELRASEDARQINGGSHHEESHRSRCRQLGPPPRGRPRLGRSLQSEHFHGEHLRSRGEAEQARPP